MPTEPDYMELYGTYLDPPHVVALDLPAPDGPDAFAVWDATLADRGHRVARTFAVGEHTVRVTHAGGIFLDVGGLIQGALPDFFDRQHQYVDTINIVVCNLNLQEAATCGPVSSADLGIALLKDDDAHVGASAGSVQLHRNAAVVHAIQTQHPLVAMWPQVSSAGLDRAIRTTHAQQLAEVSSALPELISAAAFYAYRGRPAEALVTGFIVVEQILGHVWRREIEPTGRDPTHRDRLRDTRTYNASVKTEILWRSGLLGEDAYDAIQVARKARNDFAHAAQLDRNAAKIAIRAMNLAMPLVLRDDP